MKISILGFVLIVFTVLIIIKLYQESDIFQLKCIVSTKDGNKYCVRDKENLEKSADMLADMTIKLRKLVKHMAQKYPDEERVKRLVKGFNPKKIMETLPTSEYTAYSENKGEKLAFCLTKKKNEGNMIEPNTLTFVSIHEVAHIMTKSVGHDKEFWDNFKFLLENAKEIGIYSPVDYAKNPTEYCGMDITDNPYYDIL
jgi:hypothetical protein|tara:strand:+ start:437 stop:1030 length:594 start_codon:yes stop_codon:yes gene_type:complete